MRPKEDRDEIDLHLYLWVSAVICGVMALISQKMIALVLCLPFLIASYLVALYRRGTKITVTETAIEACYFSVIHRTIPWDRIVSYREKHKHGSYYIHVSKFRTNSGYIEETYTLVLRVDRSIPLRIRNSFTNYKTFKKLLKDKQIQRVNHKKRGKKATD